MTEERRIRKRKIPSTTEQLPEIGLGTWQTFDAPVSSPITQKIVENTQLFYEEGGRLIDTSPMYGFSEKMIGHCRHCLNIQDIFLATKVWTKGRKEGFLQIQNSFEMMKTEKIDLLQIHNLVDFETHLKTLRELKEKKKIRYLGITHYLSSAFEQIESIMKKDPIDFIQIPYSVQTRDAETKLLPLAEEKNIAVIVNRPFEGGTLFNLTKNKPLPESLLSTGCRSWAQVFLRFILAHPAVTCVIPATRNPEFLRENLECGRLPLLTLEQKTTIIKEISRL